MHELAAWADYGSSEELRFWRSTSGFEVDFIIGGHTAVEVKATRTVSPADHKSLLALREEAKLKRYLCVSLEARRRTVDGITVLSYGEFLDALWEGEYR
jgi:predicted AAA+ superfamily ATPase